MREIAGLPLADLACDLIVAAFCLYHSSDPASVVAEIARCLAPGGTAVIAVKSADSYRELDRLMAASGLAMLAAHLGDVHGSAYKAELHNVQLPRLYSAPGGHLLPSFPVGRLAAVGRELSAGRVPGARLTTYQHWAPALGSSAPRLVAADTPALTIITTALDARRRPGTLPAAAHHRAGTLLRRFHNAEPPRPLPGYRAWLQDRAAYWTTQAAPLLSAAELSAVSASLTAPQQADNPQGVPCHLDFQPRNWLSGPAGHLYLVDFEHARTDQPLRDLVRLRFRVWPGRPDLKEAFLTGYGRDLSGPDTETAPLCPS